MFVDKNAIGVSRRRQGAYTKHASMQLNQCTSKRFMPIILPRMLCQMVKFHLSHAANVNNKVRRPALAPVSPFHDPFIDNTEYGVKRITMSFGGAPRCSSCGEAVYHAEQVMGPARKVCHCFFFLASSSTGMPDSNHNRSIIKYV